jgi:hypothetical protein
MKEITFRAHERKRKSSTEAEQQLRTRKNDREHAQ